MYFTVLWQQCLDNTVTALVATLVCRRCKLTMVQQRWQWQCCNNTVHISGTEWQLTALWQQLAVAALWQRCRLTALWQRCSHYCDIDVHITVKVVATYWQRWGSTVSCHRCHTNVRIVISALLLPYLCCHTAVLDFTATALCSFSLSQCCAHWCLTAVGFLLCR